MLRHAGVQVVDCYADQPSRPKGWQPSVSEPRVHGPGAHAGDGCGLCGRDVPPLTARYRLDTPVADEGLQFFTDDVGYDSSEGDFEVRHDREDRRAER